MVFCHLFAAREKADRSNQLVGDREHLPVNWGYICWDFFGVDICLPYGICGMCRHLYYCKITLIYVPKCNICHHSGLSEDSNSRSNLLGGLNPNVSGREALGITCEQLFDGMKHVVTTTG